ncbi:DinB family protein [Deinococcus sp.]|uniref:DinB family protein n=1 Tax=Deinococcus sp. TaxID=47478 RepID=UPI0025F24070|nr:DinB family protein [Deinococcus sp.]
MTALLPLAAAALALERSGQALALLAGSWSAGAARWRPEPGRWSALEVVNHLADEEKHDFRLRFCLLIDSPLSAWPRTDPQGWVTQRGYNGRDLLTSIERFGSERATSLSQLREMPEPDWSTRRGSLSALDLMASWQAHDLLHLRQLSELRYLWLESQDMNIEYAGEWPGLVRPSEHGTGHEQGQHKEQQLATHPAAGALEPS